MSRYQKYSSINPMSIRLARVQRGVSLKKIALAAGIGARHLSMVERGLQPITEATADKILEALRMYNIELHSSDTIIIK